MNNKTLMKKIFFFYLSPITFPLLVIFIILSPFLIGLINTKIYFLSYFTIVLLIRLFFKLITTIKKNYTFDISIISRIINTFIIIFLILFVIQLKNIKIIKEKIKIKNIKEYKINYNISNYNKIYQDQTFGYKINNNLLDNNIIISFYLPKAFNINKNDLKISDNLILDNNIDIKKIIFGYYKIVKENLKDGVFYDNLTYENNIPIIEGNEITITKLKSIIHK